MRNNIQYYDKNVVGNRIKMIRKKRNMTQSKLAEHLDYAIARQIQRIENGETGCSVDKLMEIAQVLEISTDFLLFGMEMRGSIIIERLEEKTEGQRRFIQKIVTAIVDNIELLVSKNS